MSHDNFFYVELIHPIAEDDLNDYVLIKKMNFNSTNLVSD